MDPPLHIITPWPKIFGVVFVASTGLKISANYTKVPVGRTGEVQSITKWLPSKSTKINCKSQGHTSVNLPRNVGGDSLSIEGTWGNTAVLNIIDANQDT